MDGNTGINDLRSMRSRLDSLRDRERQPERRSAVPGRDGGFVLPWIYVIVIALAIIITGLYIRSAMVQYSGFFEPDGFFHYSVIEQSIANGFSVPLQSVYSGFPMHNNISEPVGFYDVTLFPYAMLRYFGVSAYEIERFMPFVFAIGEMVVAYLIIRYLANSRILGLLAMFMVSLSGGDAARTSALVYRGDGFITLFLLLSLLFMVLAIERKGKMRYAYMALSPFILGIGTTVWNGSPFAIIVYMLAALMLMVYEFVRGDERASRDCVLITLGLLLAEAMVHLFMYLNIIRLDQGLANIHFFIFYAPVLLGSVVFYAVLRLKLLNLNNAKRRAAFMAVVAIAAAALMLTFFYSYIYAISTGNGLVVAGNSFITTIEELQPPSFNFLWISFSLELFLAPLAIILYIVLSRRREFDGVRQPIGNETFVVLLAYLGVTFYLQSSAVRYNAVVAVPMALFAAYAVYSVGRLINTYRLGWFRIVWPYFVVAVIILAFIFYVSYMQSLYEAQADNINPYFLNATLWLRNNTPSNSTVLTLWPDGSVVEGWGLRQSLSDSVGGQGNGSVVEFPIWLFNTTSDPAYLLKTHPDYLLARGFWFQESGGIAVEGNIIDAANYGFDVLQPLQPMLNSTAKTNTFRFVSGNFDVYMIINSSSASGNRINAYLAGSQGYSPLDRVLFFNNDNGTYSYANLTTTGVNYTLLVTYSTGGGGLNVQSAAILAQKLQSSNLFKLIVLCTASCPYNNNKVSLSLVYNNPDTKIFRVNYNTT